MARGLVALSFLLPVNPPLVLSAGEHAVPVGGGLLLVVELGHERFAGADDQRAAAVAGVGSRQGQAMDVVQQVVGNHLLEACLTLAQLASAVLIAAGEDHELGAIQPVDECALAAGLCGQRGLHRRFRRDSLNARAVVPALG